jgi:DNA-binding response OmpR family regulator
MVVLLVEDNIAEANLTREALLDAGMRGELMVVSDGESATRFLRNGEGYENAPSPNIILLDLNLPRKHGLEVLYEIKRDSTLCHIPVVVISNSDAREDIDSAYELGGNGYIVKSGDLTEYFAAVKALVEFWLCRARLPSVFKNPAPAVPMP